MPALKPAWRGVFHTWFMEEVRVIRLVAFDLDGTLLHKSNIPSQVSLQIIRELINRGIQVASISGRNFDRNQIPFKQNLTIANALYVGAYNGALVFAPRVNGHRSLMYEQRLTRDVFAELMQYIIDRRVNFVYCRCDLDGHELREIYITDRDTEQGRAVAAMTEMTYDVDAGLAKRIQAGELGIPPKVMLLPEPEDLNGLLDDLKRMFGDRIYTAWAMVGRVEVMNPAINKGRALEAIARHAGIPMSDVMAIGDGNNDLPMLQAAGVGVLMGNADAETHEAVKGQGIHVTSRVDADGFAEAVRKLVLGA